MLGLGRQFGAAEPAPDVVPDGHSWRGGTIGTSITNWPAPMAPMPPCSRPGSMPGGGASAANFCSEATTARVDRRGVAGQLWHVQPVTPRFSMSTGLGPYFAANRRDDNRTATNLLISFQAERALSPRVRAVVNFNRVKTFRKTNDRDLFQVGLLRRF